MCGHVIRDGIVIDFICATLNIFMTALASMLNSPHFDAYDEVRSRLDVIPQQIGLFEKLQFGQFR